MSSNSISGEMKVITASPPGGPEALRIETRAVPVPAAGEVLIKVHAAGVNGADLREREGKYPVPDGAPDIMGLEVSGEIAALGEDCQRFRIGDRVCALLIGGGYAEYAVAPEGQCMAIPDGVSLTDAAGLPEVYCTVWTNMMDRCALKPAETVLVQGGTSGIGCAAIQIAKAHGAVVFATARNEEKCAAMRRLGADHSINYRDEDFAEICHARTGGRGIDVVIDIIGGEYLPREVELLARRKDGGSRFRPCSQPASDHHRRTFAATVHCRKDCDLPGPRRARLAIDCRWQHFAGNICRLSPYRGCRGAPPDGIEPAYR